MPFKLTSTEQEKEISKLEISLKVCILMSFKLTLTEQ